MSTVAMELDQTLRDLDTDTASLLERAVRDALDLAQRRRQAAPLLDDLGYPVGYFEATAGSFAKVCSKPLANMVSNPDWMT